MNLEKLQTKQKNREINEMRYLQFEFDQYGMNVTIQGNYRLF